MLVIHNDSLGPRIGVAGALVTKLQQGVVGKHTRAPTSYPKHIQLTSEHLRSTSPAQLRIYLQAPLLLELNDTAACCYLAHP